MDLFCRNQSNKVDHFRSRTVVLIILHSQLPQNNGVYEYTAPILPHLYSLV